MKGEAECSEPIRSLERMFVEVVQGGRIKAGQSPAQRPVFGKTHGVALGHFDVSAELDGSLRQGIFAEARRFGAVVRFSSDTLPDRPGRRSTLGVAIKLIGVGGEKLDRQGETCDFVLQNHDVFFVNTARDMCEFTWAGVIDRDYDRYLTAHPATRQILTDMEKDERSVLSARYWGLLPHKLGPDHIVKYELWPEGRDDEVDVDSAVSDYLYVDLKTRLARKEARFHLRVQVRGPDDPLDEATARWGGAPITVGTLCLPRQDIDAAEQTRFGERLAFSIWQTTADHQPLGSIAEARRRVYAASAHNRRKANEEPEEEPTELPAHVEPAPPPPRQVVRAEIHPAIGVARVGDSDEFYIGPEVTHPSPVTAGSRRDVRGRLKREAARFRIYGYDADGKVVKELTVDDAAILWTVEVGNKKGAWYDFTLAMDTTEVNDARVTPARRRNSRIAGEERQGLCILPGPRTIHGRGRAGTTYHFDSGRFLDERVYLGELRTDARGRLLFLGGRGRSASIGGAPPYDFANNDGWFDDIADGPVSARVWVDGREVPVESAWVLSAPPNYAPELKSVRTLYDLLDDAFGLERRGKTSFREHVLPIFERLSGLQWVNRGFSEQFGFGAPHHFLRPELLEKLAANPAKDAPEALALREMRQQIYNSFRRPGSDEPSMWPWIYGDSMDFPESPNASLRLTSVQLAHLASWATGEFDSDLTTVTPPHALGDVPLEDQPAMLTRAALSFCLADAFHPGCEITWVIRVAQIYRDRTRLRLRVRSSGQSEPDFGDVLDPRVALASNGPLTTLGPGDLTRWMAVPWQTDTASCRSAYGGGLTPSTPSFWPARVPNHVLTREDYQTVMDAKVPIEDRVHAFHRRRPFFRLLVGNFYEQLAQMVERFSVLGLVERQAGPTDVAAKGLFPEVIFVEGLPAAPTSGPSVAALVSSTPTPTGDDDEASALKGQFIPKVHRFVGRAKVE